MWISKSTHSCCFQGGWVSLGKLNFGAPDWILGGWVVLENQVCNHNYTTPANEQGPGRAAGSTPRGAGCCGRAGQ